MRVQARQAVLRVGGPSQCSLRRIRIQQLQEFVAAVPRREYEEISDAIKQRKIVGKVLVDLVNPAGFIAGKNGTILPNQVPQSLAVDS